MRVLALDISTHVGWAADSDDRRGPRTGTFHLQHGAIEFGKAGAEFGDWLSVIMIDRFRPEFVAVEAAAMTGAGIVMNRDTGRLLIGLTFMAASVAAACGLGYGEYSVQTWRRHFLNHGRPENPKRQARERCRQLGWVADSDDAAEAAGLWCYAKSIKDRSFRVEAGTPLFAKAGE